MKYTSEYITLTDEQIIKYSLEGEKFQQYEINIPDDFGNVPLDVFFRAISKADNPDTRIEIARYCIYQKRVEILLDGKKIFDFQLNNFTDSFDAIKGLQDHPLAFKLLIDVCNNHIAKKSLPPLKDMPKVEAKTSAQQA